jgi:hypothetical protein
LKHAALNGDSKQSHKLGFLHTFSKSDARIAHEAAGDIAAGGGGGIGMHASAALACSTAVSASMICDRTLTRSHADKRAHT